MDDLASLVTLAALVDRDGSRVLFSFNEAPDDSGYPARSRVAMRTASR
jgi:hypothetical protein